jgi:hypothetical protein
MKAVFIELPAFERYRDDYLDDEPAGFARYVSEIPVD